MTDEVTPRNQQDTPKTDEKKPPVNGSAPAQPNVGRGQKKSGPHPRTASISNTSGTGAPRPSSRSSVKKPSTGSAQAVESGSDSNKKDPNSKKPEHRARPSTGGNVRSAGNRKGSQGSRQSSGNVKEGTLKQKQTTSTTPPSGADSSDALSSLQRVIADLKTTSPNQPSTATNNSLTASVSMPSAQGTVSSLPPNAPVFQPGAIAFPGSNPEPPRHRKAASLGTSGPSNAHSYSPNLGSMMEDVEDGQGGANIEEGEIQESVYQSSHPRRALSQSFTAPRFAALAAQQDQGETVGSSGRPQLAPGFMFGARRRPSSAMPMGPPISEEDVGFQFPQQQQQGGFNDHDMSSRKPDNGPEISGIMAEQVSLTSGYSSLSRSTAPLSRLRFRTRLRLCSSNSRLCTNSSWPLIKSSLSRLPA